MHPLNLPVLCLLLLNITGLCAQQAHIYLLSGIGSDERIFDYFECPDTCQCTYINYPLPAAGMDMTAYAHQLSTQINTEEPFTLIGVSLGGMLAVEMAHFMRPEQVIILSSACNANELPLRYRFQKQIPVYRLFTGEVLKKSSYLAQSIAEPDRQLEADICNAMLDAKDPQFLERSLEMTIEWDRQYCDYPVVHVHGSNDHTIPLRNTDADIIVEGGSHMMTLTQGKAISDLLQSILTL